MDDEDYWTQEAEKHNQKVQAHFASETQPAEDSGEWKPTTASELRRQYADENEQKFQILQSQYAANPYQYSFIQPFLQPMPKEEADQIMRDYFFQAQYEVFGSGMLSAAGFSCGGALCFKLGQMCKHVCGCCS